jgi:hypothetical protein
MSGMAQKPAPRRGAGVNCGLQHFGLDATIGYQRDMANEISPTLEVVRPH